MGAAGWSRRKVIRAIGAGVAAGALPAPVAAAMTGKGAPGRVAIIGAGMGGLTALHHLRRAGVDARLYEARGRTGGRAHTVRHADGTWFERGGQLVNSDHRDMRALARAYGVTLIDRKAAPHETRIIAGGRARSTEEVVEGLRGIAARIDADARWLDRDHARALAVLDRMSIADYLDRHAALIPQPWIRSLLEQTSRTEYGVEPQRASAIGLMFNLPVVEGKSYDVLGGSDERYLIEGGTQTLSDAMAAAHADRIETGRELIRIERSGGRMRLIFRDLSHAWADRVILAVPAPITAYIELAVPLPPLWRAFIAQMETGRNEKVQAVVASAPWRGCIGSGGEMWHCDRADLPAQGWDATIAGTDQTPIWNWYFGGHPEAVDAMPDPALLARMTAQGMPGMADAAIGAVDRTDWSHDPYARGAYVNYPPGQLSRFGRLLWLEDDHGRAEQVAGTPHLLFAGEHLSDAYPGYLNGAAQTGRLAAATLLGRTLSPDVA